MRLATLVIPIVFIVVTIGLLIMMGPLGGVMTFKDDFQKGIKPNWSPKTPDKWEVAEDGENKYYRMKEAGEQDDKVRRPGEYSLVNGYVFKDFTFTCKLRCDAPADLRCRDVVIIFGYQDDTHFYYVHFSNISDDLHNTVMIVNGDHRQRLFKEMPEAMLTDTDFHKVKLNWNGTNGSLEVYFDRKAIMKAQDLTFKQGLVGVGSFDDTASFDDVYIRGKVVKQKP